MYQTLKKRLWNIADTTNACINSVGDALVILYIYIAFAPFAYIAWLTDDETK